MIRQEYEAKLAELKKQLAELENTTIEDEEFPQVGIDYWYVDNFGDVESACWDNDHVDNYRKDFHRIFKTRLECERYLEIQLAFKQESKKFKPDWKNESQIKYYLVYNHYANVIRVDYVIRYHKHTDYFESQEMLEVLIDRFGEEDIKKYYLGIEDA